MIDNILHSYINAYYKLPQSVKVFIGTLYGNIPLSIRFGKKYHTFLEDVEKYENASNQYKLDYIYNKTYETLNFSYENIEFYKNRFDDYGVHPNIYKEPNDLYKFPLLQKKDVREYIDTMYTEKIERKKKFFTGGSMSEPTKFYLPYTTARAKEKAYINYIFSKIGANIRSKKLLLKGREIVKNDILFEYEPVENSFVLSSNHITKNEYVSKVYNHILNFKPDFIFGYPSAVLDFTKTLGKLNLRISIKGIILVSENIFTEQIEYLKEYYHCPILSQYGHTERCTMSFRIDNNNYRFLNSYGVNIVQDNEIISTGFDNFVMPLINYKTNDFLNKPVYIKNSNILGEAHDIDGRLQEFLVTKDKRLISICTMGAGHFMSISNIESIQYRQNSIGTVDFYVQSTENINLNNIKKELEDFTHNAIDFNIIRVDQIEKSPRGKKIMCLQTLDIKNL